MNHYYAWGNTKDYVGKWRMRFKGRKCKVLVRSKMNSCLIEFENHERICCSRNAIRRIDK